MMPHALDWAELNKAVPQTGSAAHIAPLGDLSMARAGQSGCVM